MAGFDLNSIGTLLSEGGVSAISKRTKVKQSDVAKVLSAGIPALLSGMADNASDPAGAEALTRAAQDHRAVNAANVGDFLKGADLKDGKKILGHVLGDNQNAMIEKIAGEAGVTKGKATSILALAAPLLLSLLGNQNSGNNMLGLLGGLLGMSLLSGNNGGGLLSGLLGGGSSSSSQSSGLLGSLLGGGSSSNESSSGGLFNSLLNLLH
ncbi:MAG: DUF937 domain-containing protein [Oscillospiraceae bacterium]|nr:DUF937 domain-containing protein [Oscillospiraceae bacterium]